MKQAIERNINNLNQFWQALTASEKGGVFTHTSWPNKQWRSDFGLPERQSFEHSLFEALPTGKSYSTLATIEARDLVGLTIKNQLTPMNLILEDTKPNGELFEESVEKIIKLRPTDSAKHWTLACGKAFRYSLDEAVIQQLLQNPSASVIAYMVNGNIAGTAISYQTGDTLGVHQLGTVPDYRKMGVAAGLMHYILHEAQQKEAVEHVSLQASKAGLHLYEKMGFNALGTLTSVANAA